MSFLTQSDEILSVGEFSRRFKMLVKTQVPELWLRGEISNLKTYSSGHTYFTLKD
ncbi:MAG: exodeoxyribonuclease VII large subunit, partial [Opitutales bacterium]|nr:exodeoxyribonuclease VII large subunit [Opitutales bacterium]